MGSRSASWVGVCLCTSSMLCLNRGTVNYAWVPKQYFAIWQAFHQGRGLGQYNTLYLPGLSVELLALFSRCTGSCVSSRGSPIVALRLMCIARLYGHPPAWCWCCGHECKCLPGLYRLGLASTGLQAYGDSCANHCLLSSPCALIAGWGVFDMFQNLFQSSS